MKFPPYTGKLKAQELIKVVSSKGSVLVANSEVLEFAYNQQLEGAKNIKIITPDGKVDKRHFRIVLDDKTASRQPVDKSNFRSALNTVTDEEINFHRVRHHKEDK